MAKLTFNANPTFQINVNVAVDGGAKDHVLITYKHRTRKDKAAFAEDVSKRYAAPNEPRDEKEVAAFIRDVSERYAALGETPDAHAVGAFAKDASALYSDFVKTRDSDETAKITAGALLEMIAAWEFEEPLTLENLQHVCNEHSAAAAAFAEAYWNSTEQARLGNSDK